MKSMLLSVLLAASPSALALCGSDALEAAENFAVHVRKGSAGKLNIVKESADPKRDLILIYEIENTIAGAGGYTEVYEVVADLDSYCSIDKVTFLGYR